MEEKQKQGEVKDLDRLPQWGKVENWIHVQFHPIRKEKNRHEKSFHSAFFDIGYILKNLMGFSFAHCGL